MSKRISEAEFSSYMHEIIGELYAVLKEANKEENRMKYKFLDCVGCGKTVTRKYEIKQRAMCQACKSKRSKERYKKEKEQNSQENLIKRHVKARNNNTVD